MVHFGKASLRAVLLALVCAVGGPGGCDRPDDARTLTVWHAWSGSEQATLKTIVARFQAANPGTTVTALPVPYNQLRNKFLTAAAANGGPDLVIGSLDWLGELHAAKVIRPLNTWMTAERRQRFLPTAVASLAIGSDTYGVPESLETLALYYNKALMPTAPADFEALTKTTVPPGVWKLALRTSFFFTAPWYLGHGGTLFDHGVPAFASPGSTAFLAWLGTMMKTPGIAGKDDYGWFDSLFRERKAAAVINGPWALSDYQKALGPELGVALLPGLPGQRPAKPFIGIKCLIANDNTPEARRPLVDAFLDTFTAPESALALAKAGHIPVQPSLAMAVSADQRIFLDQATRGAPLPNGPAMGTVWEPMDKAIAAVLLEGADPGQTMRETDGVIKARAKAVEAQ